MKNLNDMLDEKTKSELKKKVLLKLEQDKGALLDKLLCIVNDEEVVYSEGESDGTSNGNNS